MAVQGYPHPNYVSVFCKKCNTDKIYDDHVTGDCICTLCGLVLQDNRISDEAEWRNYRPDVSGQNQDKSRVGMTSQLPSFGNGSELSTSISGGSFYSKNNEQHAVSSNAYSEPRSIQKMQRLQNGSLHCPKTRKIMRVQREISTLSDNYELSQGVQIEAKKIAHKAFTKDWINRPIDHFSVSAACILIATRQQGHPRDTKEFCQYFKLKVQKVNELIQNITQHMCLKAYNYESDLQRYGSLAKMKHKQIEQSIVIFHDIKEILTLCHKPMNKIAIALFFAGNKTEQEKDVILRVTGLCPLVFERLCDNITTSSKYKEIRAHTKGIFDQIVIHDTSLQH